MDSTDSPPEATVTLSLSAAEALAASPFFDGLSPVDLARLVPELEEYQFQPGEEIFCQGDPGDGLYLIRSGTVRVSVVTESGAETVRTLGAPSSFGEPALLRDQPRSATVVAETPLAVWKLPRARFETLVTEHPQLLLRIAADLASRLADTTQKLSVSQEQVAVVARTAYEGLDPPAQALLRRAALFVTFDVALLQAVLGPTWSPAAFARLEQDAVFFHASEPDGWFRFVQESVRGFLLHQLRAEVGARGLAIWHRRAADALLARGDVHAASAVELLLAASDWRRLGHLLARHGTALAASAPERAEGYLRALPPRSLWRNPQLVRLLATCCMAQGKLEQAVAVYREAQRRDPGARTGAVARAYQQAVAALAN